MRITPVVAALGCVLALAACQGTSPAGAAPAPAGTTAPALPARVSSSIATDHGPATLLVGPDGIYVGNHRGGSVQRIDPATNRVVSTVLVGGQLRLPLSSDPAVPMWACSNVDGSMRQLDLVQSRVTATVAAECDGGWASIINGRLWVVSGGDHAALRVFDAKTGRLQHTAPLELYAGGPVLAGDRVLVGSGESGQTFAFTLDGVGPTRIPVETPWLCSAGGKLYRIPTNGDLAELDPKTLAVVRTYHVPAHPVDIDPTLVADDAGHLYYRSDYTHIYRVDTASGTVTEFLKPPWEETPTGMAFGFGSLWVTNFGADTIWRVSTAL
jgi:YVTN family beta-propeller protein